MKALFAENYSFMIKKQLSRVKVNMYVLQSFAVPTIDKFLGPEQVYLS